MADQLRPSYRFAFRSGLSTIGKVDRVNTSNNSEQVHRIGYRLDDLPLAQWAGRPIPDAVADLIDVSAAVYIADRLSPREAAADPRFPGDRWHRRIHVVLPLRHPDRWRQAAVLACLEELLGFLTDDIWSFEFTRRWSCPRGSEAHVPCLQPVDHGAATVLHSGGLDSLFGLAELAGDRCNTAIVPVTVVTNARVRDAAASVLDVIRRSAVAAPPLLPARLRIRIGGAGRARDDREPTQRARAMLFLGAGIGAAVIAGTNQLRVCENGIGAISLPMTADHWGARATRAMHPKTLLLMSRLAGLVLDQQLGIVNTGLPFTKGELAQRLDDRFIVAARNTVSCDRTTYVRLGEACGKCTSCLLRRVALVAADLDKVVDGRPGKYRTDWFDSSATWSSENIISLMAMRDQVERLRGATREQEFAALDRAFPDLFDVVTLAPSLGLTEDEVERQLLRLYTTYVREFDAFVAKIDRIGWGRRAEVTELIPAAKEAAVS